MEADTESVRRTKEEAMNNERRREGTRQYSITVVVYDERERERKRERSGYHGSFLSHNHIHCFA